MKCCRDACQFSQRLEISIHRSHACETLRDLAIRWHGYIAFQAAVTAVMDINSLIRCHVLTSVFRGPNYVGSESSLLMPWLLASPVIVSHVIYCKCRWVLFFHQIIFQLTHAIWVLTIYQIAYM